MAWMQSRSRLRAPRTDDLDAPIGDCLRSLRLGPVNLQPLTMIDARILGYTLLNSGPIDRVYLEHAPGLSVLYGLNGAGKSSVLRSLERGLSGIEGGALVHLQVFEPFAECGEDPVNMSFQLLDAGCEAIELAAGDTRVREPWQPAEWRLPTEYAQAYATAGDYFRKLLILGEAVQGILDWDLRSDGGSDGDLAALAADIAEAGVFTLTPVGTESDPSWRVDIGARPGDGSHLVDEMLRAHLSTDSPGSSDGANLDVDGVEEVLLRSATPGSSLQSETIGDDIRAGVEHPHWAPYPIAYFGELGVNSLIWPPAVLVAATDVDDASKRHLIRPTDDWDGLFEAVVDDQYDIRPQVVERITELNEAVNTVLALLVDDPPVVSLALEHPNRWLDGTSPFRWVASDRESLTEVPITSLSDFQYRWTLFALGLATSSLGDADALLLVDEPERAAHPQAVDRLSSGLAEVATRLDAAILAATHTPRMLDESDRRLMHVARDSMGRTKISTLEPWASREVDVLRDVYGLSPSDILQLTRRFLVVEGQHEMAALDVLFGDELARQRVRVVTMRGTKNLLSLLDSQFLMTYSDARFIVLVDNVASGKVHKAYDALRVARPNVSAALKSLTNGSSEEQTIAELLSGAHRAGRLDRIEIFGLTERDVLRYLPASSFLPDVDSWREVDERRDRSLLFKDGLRAMGAQVSIKAVRKAAGSMDSIPAELSALLQACSRPDARPQP